MVPIFDMCLNIKNREGFKDCSYELLDILHAMLVDMKVPHAFVLEDAEEINKINSKGYEYCCSLMYCEKDKLVCEMVYTLWNKVYRDAPDRNVIKALSLIGTYAPFETLSVMKGEFNG